MYLNLAEDVEHREVCIKISKSFVIYKNKKMLLRGYFLICGPKFAHLICRLLQKSFIMTNSKIGRKLDHTQFLEFNYTDAAGTQIQNISQKK